MIKHVFKTVMFLCLLVLPFVTEAVIRRVDVDLTTGANNGTSWADAYQGEYGLVAAIAASSAGDEIWVKAGTYYPAPAGTRNVPFTLKAGVAIYGGFAGGETLLSQRDVTTNVTILTGDLDGSNSPTTFDAYEVVKVGTGATAATTILDGVHIVRGFKDPTVPNTGSFYRDGVAIKAYDFGATFRNCKVYNNTNTNSVGSGYGAAMLYNAPSVFDNCEFYNNSVFTSGGIYAWACASLTITNCVFRDMALYSNAGVQLYNTNASFDGCRFANLANTENCCLNTVACFNLSGNGQTTFNNCVFEDITASFARVGYADLNSGASLSFTNCTVRNVKSGFINLNAYSSAIGSITFDKMLYVDNENNYGSGAFYFSGEYAFPVFNNCVFANNSKTFLISSTFLANTTIKNCTFANNSGTSSIACILASNSTVNVSNTVLYGNTATAPLVQDQVMLANSGGVINVSHSLIQGTACPTGVTCGTGVVYENCLSPFVNGADADGADNTYGTADDGISLSAATPARNGGDNTGVSGTDITGTARIMGGTVDMGAYEIYSTCSVNASTVTINSHVSCHGAAEGSFTVSGASGASMGNYELNYLGGGCAGPGAVWIAETSADQFTVNGLLAGTYALYIRDANDQSCFTFLRSITITQPAALTTPTATPTHVNCHGASTGQIALSTPTGGVAPEIYDYNWGLQPGSGSQVRTGLPAGTYTVTVTACTGNTTEVTATITQPAALSASVSGTTHNTCRGASLGSISISNPTGGVSPESYDYNWGLQPGSGSQVRTGLPAGTYTVTITACSGSTLTLSATITEPAALSASVFSTTHNTCHGASLGSITISNPTGGVSPAIYDYNWGLQPGSGAQVRTGLPAGTYTVTITACTGNTLTLAATVTQPAAISTPTATPIPATIACPGDLARIEVTNVNGGVAPESYTYTWSTTLGTGDAIRTGLPPGTYTVTVFACSGQQSIVSATIAGPPPMTATTSMSNITASGARVNWLTVPTATMYRIRYKLMVAPASNWLYAGPVTGNSFNITGLQANSNYEVEVAPINSLTCPPEYSGNIPFKTATASTTTSCVAPANIYVTVTGSTTAMVYFTGSANSMCYGISYGISGTNPSTWQEAWVAAPASSFPITGLEANKSYRVQIRTNCTTCSSPASLGTRSAYSVPQSFSTVVTRSDFDMEAEAVNTLSLYPNPATGSFTVKMNTESAATATLRLTDITGKVILERAINIESGETLIPVTVEGYTKGIYMLSLTTEHQNYHAKVVLN